MAYVALVSLMQTLEQIINSDEVSIPYEKQGLGPLLEKLSLLLVFLEESSQNSSEEVKSLERRIRNAAYHAEDIIEGRNFLSRSESMMSDIEPQADLQKISTEIDSIMVEAGKITDLEKRITEIDTLVEEANSVVGFGEDLKKVRDRLCNEEQPQLQIIPIVGMGGSDNIVVVTDDIRKARDEQLKEYVHKNLKCKRYLIVVDDVWTKKAWNEIQMLFPNDNNGSRIILTTRLSDVADYVGSSNTRHQMHFLNEEDSWNLFLAKVFGKENCPPELVDVGMRIAKNCQGLPLLIVVIGGFLSKVNKTQDYWKYVAENLSSIIAEKDNCLEILTLSYSHLPPHLKACFLYMGVFPENYEIPVSRLIKLWVAEGFVKPHESKCLEEVAGQYLMDLIDRNLILVRQKGSLNGKIKTCSMHDLLRQLCVRMAREENFLCVKSRYMHAFLEDESYKRRLSIHDDASYSPNDEDFKMQSMYLVRSFIYTGWDDTRLHSFYYFGYLLLRVLDMVGVELVRFPEEILQLFNLRYIAIMCHISINSNAEIPPSISLLRNLHTLIIVDPSGITIKLPVEIWSMPQLRHLKFSRVFLPPPIILPIEREQCFVLENLETLSMVEDLGYTKQVLETIPNVKKLGPEWVPTEGEFPKLTFLLIWETNLEHWRVDHTRFPRLEHLILGNCSKLVEIPSGIGEILTLEIIEIDDSSLSAVKSANDILEVQQSQGYDGLQVLVHPKKERFYPSKFGLQQDESGLFHTRETKLDRLKIKKEELDDLLPNVVASTEPSMSEEAESDDLFPVVMENSQRSTLKVNKLNLCFSVSFLNQGISESAKKAKLEK
ncbi:late blight resistance homolog R1B-17 [Olea europaea subsp. europaea]|uniref:Late blight resistance homolog R1B-17 n=1 Tax=Olea europaea subsp. europaea TaxID=158383 RepID=A0A8S0U4R6_OLEEU|nr:late blight resistance homolog R1B-17 [Olea europaea subsp. europaea]